MDYKSNLKKIVFKIFSLGKIEPTKALEIYDQLQSIKDSKKLEIIFNTISVYNDSYIARRARIDSRFAFIISLGSIILSAFLAIFIFLNDQFNITSGYYIIYILYGIFQIFFVIYLLVIYLPRSNYTVHDQLKFIESAQASSDHKDLLRRKISADFAIMYAMDDDLEQSNKIIINSFLTMGLNILVGVVLVIATIITSTAKISEQTQIKKYLIDLQQTNSKSEIILEKIKKDTENILSTLYKIKNQGVSDVQQRSKK